MMNERRCTRCKESKPLKLFCKDRRRADGVRELCKSCRSNDRRIVHKASKNRQAILKEQNNSCAICGVHVEESATRFVIDHNHETNTVRGILCNNCNVGLGFFKDQPGRLGQAIKYLMDYDALT
jgi:hypothetical protein